MLYKSTTNPQTAEIPLQIHFSRANLELTLLSNLYFAERHRYMSDVGLRNLH